MSIRSQNYWLTLVFQALADIHFRYSWKLVLFMRLTDICDRPFSNGLGEANTQKSWSKNEMMYSH
jgi:hypothetical protein